MPLVHVHFVCIYDVAGQACVCSNGSYKQFNQTRVSVYVGMCVSVCLQRLIGATMWPED